MKWNFDSKTWMLGFWTYVFLFLQNIGNNEKCLDIDNHGYFPGWFKNIEISVKISRTNNFKCDATDNRPLSIDLNEKSLKSRKTEQQIYEIRTLHILHQFKHWYCLISDDRCQDQRSTWPYLVFCNCCRKDNVLLRKTRKSRNIKLSN